MLSCLTVYDILIMFFYLVMTGDNLAAIDPIGVPSILPSRAAKTSFVTTASGRALYAHKMFHNGNPNIGNQPSSSVIGNPDIGNQPPPTPAASGTGTSRKRARESRPAPASDPAQASDASVPPPAGSLANATDARVKYFTTLTRNNTVLSRVRFLAFQSTISANRKREEVLELQRLELVERLKKLDPSIAIPHPKQPLFSYTNDLCMADPSDLLFLDEEEEEEIEDD